MQKMVRFAFLQNVFLKNIFCLKSMFWNVFEEHFQRKCNGLNWWWSVEFFVQKLEELIKIALPHATWGSHTFHPVNFSVLLVACYVRLCVYAKFLNWYTLVKNVQWRFACLCTILEVSYLDIKTSFFLLVVLKISWADPIYSNYLSVSPGKWQLSDYFLFSLRVTTLLANILWAEAPQNRIAHSFRKVFDCSLL